MRVILLILLMLLISLSTINAESTQQAFKTDATLKIEGCNVKLITEDNNANFDTTISNTICNSSNASFSFTKSVSIVFIRNVSSGDSPLENLTRACLDKFGQVDYISNFTDCQQSRVRLEETFKTLHTKFGDVEALANNKTLDLAVCSSQLIEKGGQLVLKNSDIDGYIKENNIISIERDKFKSDRVNYFIFALLLGVIGTVVYMKRAWNPKESFNKFEHQTQSNNPLFSERIAEEMKKEGKN